MARADRQAPACTKACVAAFYLYTFNLYERGWDAVADDKRIDPFDVEALEKSLNDSATRVSTIWISFLIFALYLLTAATTITHRQLLLAEPVKLPLINIDLPLWGFFFLVPILFVIFHIYVLLQVLLLGRTAAAYNEALDRAVRPPPSNAAMRQRLANTLFAQIFAGSPRERGGWLGLLLKAMAWITLAVAPVLILLAFQLAFLPYHSHLATWTHRLLILSELAVVFLFWPLVLDPQRDFEWRGFRKWVFPLVSCGLFVFLSLWLLTFPGEPHVNLLTGKSPSSVQCERWFHYRVAHLDPRFGSLILSGVDVVDDEKLVRNAKATADRGLLSWQGGERTRDFHGRDLNCSDLSAADLRGVDLSGARMTGAWLFFVDLQQATLTDTVLRGASMNGAKLQSAGLVNTQLQHATLRGAKLQGSYLSKVELQGANLTSSELQGAWIEDSQLQGANLDDAQLQGATIIETHLQGASLTNAQLQGASVTGTGLEGANLGGAQLQGARFDRSVMTHAILSNNHVWRATGAACHDARVSGHKPDAIIPGPDGDLVQAMPGEIGQFIEASTADIPDLRGKEATSKRMHVRLVADTAKDDTGQIEQGWHTCEETTSKKLQAEFDSELARFLRDLVCGASDSRDVIANGIIDNWISEAPDRHAFSARLASGLLGLDGRGCAATTDFDEGLKEALRNLIAAAGIDSPTAPAK
jgi:uncharacterized protein YjbI with pentapeptide repeats